MKDLQLARGFLVDGFNLSIGEPEILQDRLHPLFLTNVLYGPSSYPTLQGEPTLVAEIERLHPGYEVVVTCGAKQALLAAFWALKRAWGADKVLLNAPYWLSFPTLAEHVGLDTDAIRTLYKARQIRLVVSPNNPDGAESWSVCDVWDAVYAHPLYGWSGIEPPHLIRIGSASKMLGMSGSRVGWLLTKNQDVAELARTYVETTTSGVAKGPQVAVANALRRVRQDFDGRVAAAYEDTRRRLLENADMFRKILGPYLSTWRVPPTTGGVFAWFQPKLTDAFDVALAAAKVAVARGEGFGAPGWYRVNLMSRDLREALLKLDSLLGG